MTGPKPNQDRDAVHPRWQTAWAVAPLIVAGLFVAAVTCWPGDVPWGGDDVALIYRARTANAAGRTVTFGLSGSFRYPYGPVPIQIYQLLLHATHGMNAVVRLHAGLFAGGTLVGLLWLTRSLKMSPWLALLPVVGPFFWFYCRLLWDNTMAIPVGTLMLAAYVDWWPRPVPWKFWIVATAAPALLLIHAMTLPLVAAVGFHAAVTRFGNVRRSWISLTAIGIAFGFLVVPYVHALQWFRANLPPLQAVADPTDYPPLPRLQALAYPLLSGRLLSAYRFFDDRGLEPGLESTTLGRAVALFSTIVFVIVAIGIVAAGFKTRRGWTASATPLQAVATVAFTTVLFQCVLDGALRVAAWPHYFCGTWVASAVLFWIGLRTIRPRALSTSLAITIGLATAGWTAAFAVDIHRYHGGPVWYGPTMESQGVRSADQVPRR